jgi:hypothetical protein
MHRRTCSAFSPSAHPSEERLPASLAR